MSTRARLSRESRGGMIEVVKGPKMRMIEIIRRRDDKKGG